MVLIGVVTYYAEYRLTDSGVKEQTAELAGRVADEVRSCVTEYPAYRWLLAYWYEHAGDLDVEYDADFGAGTRTEEKCLLLKEHCPGLQIRYASEERVRAMAEEDQKLFAEITYSWLITRIDEIKQNLRINYLFCVVTDTADEKEAYHRQFFLFSAAEPGVERGTEYEQVYPLGLVVSVKDNESIQSAMRHAVEDARREQETGAAQRKYHSRLAYAGSYVDFYSCVDVTDGRAVLVGLTYDVSGLRAQIRSQTWLETACSVLFQILLVMLIIRFIVLYVLHPLKDVQQNISLYRETKNSKPVKENLTETLSGKNAAAVRANEIGELAEDVISLTAEVDDYIARIAVITAENERIVTELSLAAAIQNAMLPRTFPAFPDRTEFDVCAVMDPAKEVGGDFYDFFLVDEDHLCLVVADVSGKGVPAALYMTVAKVVMQSFAMQGSSPAEILAGTNRAICANNKAEMFVTAWVGILEISTGRLTAANAGHEYPALKRKGRYELFRDRHGFVIGAMEEARYREYTLQLEAGDAVTVYTDGVVEANNAAKEQFGPQRLIAALNGGSGASCEEEVAAVKAAVYEFIGGEPRFDDVTILSMQYRGCAAAEDEGRARDRDGMKHGEGGQPLTGEER